MNNYILTGIKRGTTVASPNTINSEIVTEEEFKSQYSWMSSDPTFFTDMIGQAKSRGKTYWLSEDKRFMFMLKKI